MVQKSEQNFAGKGINSPGHIVSKSNQVPSDKCRVVPGLYCICSHCKARVMHPAGMPCFMMTCPECGQKMSIGKVLFDGLS
jgi:hypothetical protein